jgi:spore photoproduct lyase
LEDYSTKFTHHIGKTQFRALKPETQTFIEEKASTYPLSFQDIKNLIDIAIDLSMWQETPLEKLWEDKPNKKQTLQHIKQQYRELKEKPKSYHMFTPLKVEKQFKFTTIEQEKVGFGSCPVASEKTRCCNLLTLDAVQSCGFDCSYCSIQSFYNEDTIGFDTNLKERLDKIELDPHKTYHIGTGQSSDSLMWGNRHGILDALFRFAKENPNVILEFKTKSNNITYLLEHDVPKNIVCTWSLNPQTIIDNEEHRTASLVDRIASARALANKGVLVGFHFHPIVVYKNYLQEYEEVVQRLLEQFTPQEVVLVSMGTLTFIRPVIKKLRTRALQSKILQMPLVDAGGKLSYPLSVKEEMFSGIYEMFKPWHNKVYFYMCMEHIDLWQKVFGYEYDSNEAMEKDMVSFYSQKIEENG